MARQLGAVLGVAIGALGCSLLTPYPGGGDPAEAIVDTASGKPFDEGTTQDPLFDPAIDSSVTAVTNVDDVIAIPGSAFTIDLGFTAENMNVVGGGIQFPGSDEIQWTFISELEGMASGDIRFGYVVAKEVCEDIPSLCHEILTKQFAVARNTQGDVDGDGVDDGEFVVSKGVDVRVILNCASCESPSCQELLPPSECFQCVQPQVCKDYFDRCLAEGKPNFGMDEADLFDSLFGQEGVLWSSAGGCALGEKACEDAQAAAEEMPDVCGL